MSLQVEAWYRDQWATRVIQRFQSRGYVLKGMTEPPVRIEGKKFKFLRTDIIEVTEYTRGDDVQVQNPEDDLIEMESLEWDAAVHLYDFDQSRISVNEADARQYQCATALGRQADRITYNAAMSGNLPADQIVGDYSTGLDPYMLLDAQDRLVQNDVEFDGQVFCGVPSRQWHRLMTYEIFANAEWTGPDLPLLKMMPRRTWGMVNYFLLPPHLEKRSGANGVETRFRMWHQSALGAGHNEEVRNEWERQATKKRWFVNHTVDGCAVKLLDEGFVEIRVKTDAPIEAEIQRTQAVV